MNPNVSVVIAVYNTAQYIEQCVRSLFGQTLVDMEFIFVDDKSSDGSMDIVSKVLEEYPNRKEQVHIIYHEENQGVADTKNDGIKSATGEYLIIIDPDDYVELNMMEEMYKKAVEECAEMVICDFYRFDETDSLIVTTVPEGVIGNGENVRDDIINRREPPYCVVRLINRTLFCGAKIVWPVGRFAEDIIYSTVTAYYANKIVHLNAPLYHYRVYPKSLVHEKNDKAYYSKYIGNRDNVDIMIDFLKSVGAEDKYWKGIIIQKLRVKNRLLPIINKEHNRRLWFKTYPEINKILFWGDSRYHSTYREKVWMICIALGLYPKLKRYLVGRKLRPYPQWIVF